MDVDLEPAMRDALTKGDPKVVLSILLTLVVMALRERVFANVKMQNKLGDVLRWLATTHWGGVLSSAFASMLGAAITSLSLKTWPSPGVLLNVLLIAAAASGFSTWVKLRKQSEDKAANALAEDLRKRAAVAEKEPEPLPPPPPAGGAGPLIILILAALGMMLAASGCETARQIAYGFKGTASYAVLETQRSVEDWNKKELDHIAETALSKAEGDAALKKQDEKARAITKVLKVCTQAIRALNDALIATNAVEQKDWLRLVMAIVDAFNAVRTSLATYDVKIPIPDLKLPGGL